jgi:hypothetical protein
MGNLADQRERANSLLRHKGSARVETAGAPEASMMGRNLRTGASPAPHRNFSPFIEQDALAAAAVAARMARAAKRGASSEEGLDAALDIADRVIVDESRSGVGKFGLELFATHSPIGRELRLQRPIEADPASLVGSTLSTSADPVSYWREDPLANEHHLHWHVVYPSIGIIRDDAPEDLLEVLENRSRRLTDDEMRQVVRYQDRHGEMFIYMHQQMLARYDAERLALGLQPVQALDLDQDPVDLGDGIDVQPPIEFDPGRPEEGGYQDRPDGARLDPAWRARLHRAWSNLGEAVSENAFRSADGGSIAINADLLGVNIEASTGIFRGGVDRDYYGNMHNDGHNGIAAVPADPGGPRNQIPGVMATPQLNLRDPVFWRWHRLIDDLSAKWQDLQEVESFPDLPAARLVDLQLFPDEQVGAVDTPERVAFVAALSADWEAAVAAHAVEQLETRIRQVEVPMPDGSTRQVRHLVHSPFGWAARIRNDDGEAKAVTIRLFLSPTSRRDDRRSWIELDKHLVNLDPHQEIVAVRSGAQSEVVKKPVDQGPDFFVPSVGTDDPRCNCGWPYPMLIPRGTEQGINYSLFAVLTDAAIDGFANTKTCGSVSFCGARDTTYMDKREMGYPFNRRWESPIASKAGNTPQMALRSISIVHR